nr:hypothetical protein [Rhodoferax sp.]
MRFSSRLAANKAPRALIFEDAPRKTRIGYLKSVLPEFVGTTTRGYGQRTQPLDPHETHEKFIALIRDEAETWDYDRESSMSALTEHLKGCEWPEFYDFIELVGQLLKKKDDEVPFGDTEYFEAYTKKVNALLQEDGIGWNLNDKSELTRQIPRPVAKRAEAARDALKDKFAPARVHYQKATDYLYRHPIDEANSIKEIVSAVESVARTVEPKATTLGGAIKLLQRDPRFSTYLLEGLEKLYVYSNATPQVRHGHPAAGKPSLEEAELAHAVGVAYILYLIAASRANA